jgi:hypothetical protein
MTSLEEDVKATARYRPLGTASGTGGDNPIPFTKAILSETLSTLTEDPSKVT